MNVIRTLKDRIAAEPKLAVTILVAELFVGALGGVVGTLITLAVTGNLGG